MKKNCRFRILALLVCILLELAGCSGETCAESNNSDFNNMLIEKATELSEEDTFAEEDIYIDSIRYGQYSQTDVSEMLVLFKCKNNVHVAGLDRTLAVIFDAESLEVIAHKSFEIDEVTLKCLPTEGESRILFLGRSSSSGLTSQYVELYTIQQKEWVEVPLEGITLQGDELCYITDDNSLIVVPRETGDYPTQMFVLWEEQVMYDWDELTGQFIDKQISAESARKIMWDDLDGNGQMEYFILSGDGVGTLSLYFNNELIYRYEEQNLSIVGITGRTYIDLDGDGKEEIFVSFLPNVNSMPLTEWFALKKGGNGWELMEMYHEGDNMTQNAFPISVVLKEQQFLFSITCEGCEKEILYDATNHYESKKQDKEEENDSFYNMFAGSNFEVGDTVGETSSWGIWDINWGTYEGRNCLIAEHGLNGMGGKFDFFGCVDVYFCYDENAEIKILDIAFRESE